MRYITKAELQDVFLLIVKSDAKHRPHVPIIRRHFRSVSRLCAFFKDRNVDIYFSGIFVASKKANATKIIMDKEYTEKYEGQFYEVSA